MCQITSAHAALRHRRLSAAYVAEGVAFFLCYVHERRISHLSSLKPRHNTRRSGRGGARRDGGVGRGQQDGTPTGWFSLPSRHLREQEGRGPVTAESRALDCLHLWAELTRWIDSFDGYGYEARSRPVVRITSMGTFTFTGWSLIGHTLNKFTPLRYLLIKVTPINAREILMK